MENLQELKPVACGCGSEVANRNCQYAYKPFRPLYSAEQLASVQRDNDELLGALKSIMKITLPDGRMGVYSVAREAIAKMEKP